ncbi:SPOR domain-containing protein [Actibacterium sp. MT2.3-13A]|uniref:SPOR domain-containing protein n=1 Tax=Actibacterium sp. MT2.3-13A TaxID=2828332 RepID=UPI001BA496D1|nr:SPOR domain-containing protein [Actibacterium sp. MT2.3-13A]
MAGFPITRMALMLGAALALAGCQDGADLFRKKETDAAEGGAAVSTRLVERDVEAPEVFQVSEAGLWDGRPSLGGVWVAYPGVTDPERVIIRNEANGKFVIGALFRRERDNPGPRLQVSSDTAAALGLVAGQPTPLNVTALRREEVQQETPAETAAFEAPEAVEETPLDPLASAAAAIDAAEGEAGQDGGETTAAAAPAPKPQPVPAPAPQPSKLAKPFIQIGIFSVQANAERTGDALRKAGIVPTVLKQESRGKTFWRVTVGPAASAGERATLLKQIKGLGYADAYFVTN